MWGIGVFLSLPFLLSAYISEVIIPYQPDILNTIKWIEANTDYVYSGEPLPDIVVDTRLLAIITQRPDAYGTIVVGSRDESVPYRIIISHNAPADTVTHELIHYMQFINNVTPATACLGDMEYEAYRISNKWIVDKDIDAPFANPITMLGFLMACNDSPPSEEK